MRIATFNLESLDLPPKAHLPLETRAAVLRPGLMRLDADIVCLQEVNGQHVHGRPGRELVALDQLLAGTPYAGYNRVATSGPDGRSVADVHNLVILSRHPIARSEEIRHQLLPPLQHSPQTPVPPEPGYKPLRFDRPLLAADIALPDGRSLSVINLHLRAPLAATIAGQKQAPFVWKSVSGWAEGYFVSAARRAGQALELRFLIDRLLDVDPQRLIAVAGDFNAEDHETPLKLAVGAEEDTGNGALASRALVVLDRAIAADRRWSVLHHGRPQMLDHILASRALYGHFRAIEVHNEALGDEAVAYGKSINPPGSYHAAVVAEFALAAA